MGTSPCPCAPIIPCRTRWTASCTRCWRLWVSHMTSHMFFSLKSVTMCFISHCVLSSVRNPPSEPSVYLSLPPKQLDKMGFDEVRMARLYHTTSLCFVLYYSIFNCIFIMLYIFIFIILFYIELFLDIFYIVLFYEII